MRLSLKSKTILLYSFSPFFTGFILFFIYGVYNILSENEFDLVSTLIGAPLGVGGIALIIFFIPAMVVGMILYNLRERKKLYQLFISICSGFLISFLFTFVISGFSLSEKGICLAAGILGAVTSFTVTLKIIYYPFK